MRKVVLTTLAALGLSMPFVSPASATVMSINTVDQLSCTGTGQCVDIKFWTEWDDSAQTVRSVMDVRCYSGSGTHQCTSVLNMDLRLHKTDANGDVVIIKHLGGSCGTSIGHTACPNGNVSWATGKWPNPVGFQGWYTQAFVQQVCYADNNCNVILPDQHNDTFDF